MPSSIEGLSLPPAIVTTHSRRVLQARRKKKRKEIDRINTEQQAQMYREHVYPVYREHDGIAQPFQTVKRFGFFNREERLVSKISIIEKNWSLHALNGELDDAADPVTVVWHRDIVAAKCILIKGIMHSNEY